MRILFDIPSYDLLIYLYYKLYTKCMRTILNISLPSSLASEVKREVKEGKFASTSEFFRHLLRLWNTEKLSRDLKQSEKDWKNGRKNWKKLNSVRDLV